MSLTVRTAAPVPSAVKASAPASSSKPKAPAIAPDTLLTSTAKPAAKGDHTWKVVGITGLVIGGVSLAGVGALVLALRAAAGGIAKAAVGGTFGLLKAFT